MYSHAAAYATEFMRGVTIAAAYAYGAAYAGRRAASYGRTPRRRVRCRRAGLHKLHKLTYAARVLIGGLSEPRARARLLLVKPPAAARPGYCLNSVQWH